MTVRDILLWPDARLASPCPEVEAITSAIAALADDLLETMYAAPGRGLAAPQVGAMTRLFVMDAGWKEGEPAPRVFVNPEITARSATKVVRSEGCLSIPGVSVDVARPETVCLRWTGLDGADHEAAFSGFEAACVQHELDHLDGIVTLDRIDDATRAGIIATYNAVKA